MCLVYYDLKKWNFMWLFILDDWQKNKYYSFKIFYVYMEKRVFYLQYKFEVIKCSLVNIIVDLIVNLKEEIVLFGIYKML